MVLQCCVNGCGTVGTNTFHSFPTNKLNAEKWIAATKAFHLLDRLTTNKLSNSFYKVCRKHFAEADLTVNGKGQTVVKQGSVPSLFLPNESDGKPTSSMTLNVIGHQHHQRSLAASKSSVQSGNVHKQDERGNGNNVTLNATGHQRSLAANKLTMQSGNVHKQDESGNEIIVTQSSQLISGEDNGIHGSGSKTNNRSDVTRAANGPRSNTLSYYKRRVKTLQEKVKINKLNDSAVLNYLKTKFNEQLMEIISMQLKNCGRSKHGRRYTNKQKSLCLAMYKQGPKSYRFNEKWCCLPTKRTLGRYSAQLIFRSGFDSKVLAAVKDIVKDWPVKDRYCSFGWDEVSLNEHLDYCHAMDRIEGFVETYKPKVPVFATHSLTFMVRGIQIPFKQTIGYFYTNGVKSFELVELIKLMIPRVIAAGLIPILSVCDTCIVNASAVNALVYPNSSQTKQTGDLLLYKVNGQRIIHTYDPPHLIKVIRNNLQVKNLAHFVTERWRPGLNEDYKNSSLQVAMWGHINLLYRKDIKSFDRQLKKLTDEHLNPTKLKMKVSVATQVFSNTCGNLMLQYVNDKKMDADCVDTARLILFFNDLFDSVNGTAKYPADSLKSAIKVNSIHFEFWKYALIMLENMFFMDMTTGERNNRSTVLKKFESTVRGYQEVAQMCFEAGISKLNIRDTNQDGLENFFGCVKSCNQSNKTTARQFRTGYATMVINNITGTNSIKSNCQPDDSTAILTFIDDFISTCQKQPHDQVCLLNAEPGLFCENANVDPEWDDINELNSMILFEPEKDVTCTNVLTQSETDDLSQCLETNVDKPHVATISNDASRICQKLLKSTACAICKENFDLMDQEAALLSIQKLLVSLNKTIANICSEESIKKKLLDIIDPVDVHIIGCVEHADVVARKVKILAIDNAIFSFCNSINALLSGKEEVLPDKPNSIQKLAFEHRVRKRGIGKFSDKFN